MIGIGSRIDSFRLNKLLGSGKAGSVFLAVAEQSGPGYKPGQEVALKIYKDWILEDEANRDRIHREFWIPTKLQCEHLIKPIAIKINTDVRFGTYLVMPVIKGEQLDQWINRNYPRKEKLSTEYLGRIRSILEQLLKAISCLHEGGVIHRDVKPQNIMILDNKVTLMDMGVIKVLSEHTITESDAFLGTIRYADPQYLFSGKLSQESDYYSVILTAYYLLYGRAPYSFIKQNQFARLIAAIKDKKLHKFNLKEIIRRLHTEDVRVGWAITNVIARTVLDRYVPTYPRLLDIFKNCHKTEWWFENIDALFGPFVKKEIVIDFFKTGNVTGKKTLVEKEVSSEGGYGHRLDFISFQNTLFAIRVIEQDADLREWVAQRWKAREESYIPAKSKLKGHLGDIRDLPRFSGHSKGYIIK